MNTATVHKHFHFGVAPFRFVGIWSAPSKSLCEHNPEAYNNQMRSAPECCHFSCDHCGTGIMNHCIIVDAEGNRFAVGTDCVAKTDHTEIISKVKQALRKQAQAKRDAARQAKQAARNAAYEADIQAQRDTNGGLTDYEVFQAAQEKARQNKLALAAEITAPVVSILEQSGGDFCLSIARAYSEGSAPTYRAKDIVIEIVAKQAGRKGSKAYEAALDSAEDLVESIEVALKNLG
jgi:alanyl-tRNA synthetase